MMNVCKEDIKKSREKFMWVFMSEGDGDDRRV